MVHILNVHNIIGCADKTCFRRLGHIYNKDDITATMVRVHCAVELAEMKPFKIKAF